MKPNNSTDFGIVVDIQALQNPLHRERGIGRYIIDHVDALIDAGAPLEALVLNPMAPVPHVPEHWIDRRLMQWNTPAVMRSALQRWPNVVYHIASPFEPTVPESGLVTPHGVRDATVLSVTVFDVIPYVFPAVHQPTETLRSFFRRRARLISTADLVLTISEHTRTDSINTFALDPNKVVNTSTGGAAFFAPSDRRPKTDERSYVLTVSGWGDPRKDPSTTFRAYASLPAKIREQHRLVVVCNLPPEGNDAWRHETRELGLRDEEVHFTGHIDDEELRSLYTHAEIYVTSSRYEGFGLPVLEAARCGTPSLTTSVSSLPEVLAYPPATFPPGDHISLARLLQQALTDAQFRAALLEASQRAAATYTWDRVAATTVAAWTGAVATHQRRQLAAGNASAGRSAVAGMRHRTLPHSLRIAIAGPFPPSKSGIGTFNARVGVALARDHDIDWFTEGDDCMPPPSYKRDHGQYPIAALGRTLHPGSYDGVIYTIGNGHYHPQTLRAALRTPGIVWLHDAHLAGLYLTANGLFLPDRDASPSVIADARSTMAATVAEMYGPGNELGDDEWWRTDAYDRRGLTMLSGLLHTARALIVNTEAAGDIARSEAPMSLPIHILPLPYPTSTPRDEAPDRDSDRLVVSLGWVDPMKRPHDLIRAVAHSRNTIGQRIRVAFVGELAPNLHAELVALAQSLHLEDSVVFTGFIPDEEYNGWLANADIAVQLRTETRGEASAALGDAIAHGIPTITTITTAEELPAGVVEFLDPASDARAISDKITELLTHPETRSQLRDRALSHAATWHFDDLAARVVEIVRETSQRTAERLTLPIGQQQPR